MTTLFNKLGLSLALAASLLLVMSLLVSAQQSAIFSGKVVNRTEGAASPAGLRVTLRTLDSDGNIEDRTTEISEAGQFHFEDVTIAEDYAYGLFADYQEVRYSMQIVSVPPTAPLELSIYEAGATGDAILFDNNVMIIGWADVENGVIGVLESVAIVNSSDRSFVSNVGQTGTMDFLRFSLPPSYLNLDVQSNLGGGQVVPVDRGFGLTTPIPPGHHEILFTYLIEYEGSTLNFARSFPFGANSFEVMIPEDLATLTIPGMEVIDTADIGGTRFFTVQEQDIPRDTKFEITIQELPRPSFLQSVQSTLGGSAAALIGIPTFLGLVLAGLLIYVMVLRRSRGPMPVMVAPEGDRQALIASIARLDERFERGEIEEKDYEEKRTALKSKLLRQTEEISDKDS